MAAEGRKIYETCLLPRDIIHNILVKLPPGSILHCKLVCKEWWHIISDPLFAKTHYENSRVNLIFQWKTNHQKNAIAMIETYKIGGGDQRFESLKLDLSSTDMDDFEIVNPCRGLLLLRGRTRRRSYGSSWYPLYVCNPLTNEYVTLPEIQSPWFMTNSQCMCGLGYSSITKQYKVVRVSPVDLITYEVEIYTIGTRGWKRCIKEGACHYDIAYPNDVPIDFNGVLHWLVKETNILCFNIDKEELDLMPLPCVGISIELGNIGVIHASLYLSIATSDGVDLWVMKDYGVKESWTRLVVIHDIPDDFRHPSHNRYQLVEICDNGEIVLLLPCYYMMSYDPDKKCSTYMTQLDFHLGTGVQLYTLRNQIKIQLYIPSFFSPS